MQGAVHEKDRGSYSPWILKKAPGYQTKFPESTFPAVINLARGMHFTDEYGTWVHS